MLRFRKVTSLISKSKNFKFLEVACNEFRLEVKFIENKNIFSGHLSQKEREGGKNAFPAPSKIGSTHYLNSKEVYF